MAHVINLEKYDYFGELALLQGHGPRNATVTAKQNSELLGIFRPDVEELMANGNQCRP